MQLKETFERVRAASKSLTALTDQQRNEILQAVANAIIDFKERILVANAQDLASPKRRHYLTVCAYTVYPFPSELSA